MKTILSQIIQHRYSMYTVPCLVILSNVFRNILDFLGNLLGIVYLMVTCSSEGLTLALFYDNAKLSFRLSVDPPPEKLGN
jgi:hypothetical protein